MYAPGQFSSGKAVLRGDLEKNNIMSKDHKVGQLGH